MTTLAIRCACGQVRGEIRDVAPTTANSVTCYCTDCRAFGTFLGRDDVLDAAGGTTILATFPSHYTLTSGADRVRAVRLTGSGLYRWYADCCQTPLGNHMPWARPPFVGVPFRCIEGAPEGVAEVVGYEAPPINGGKALAPVRETASGTLGAIWRALALIWRIWRTGSHTVPFPRDEATRVRVLTPDERAALSR